MMNRSRFGSLFSFSLLILASAVTPLGAADAPITLPGVTVKAPQPTSFTAPTTEESKVELDRVPGATTLITREEIDSRVHRGLEDVLLFSPGVFSASYGSGPEMTISVRGAGILQSGALVAGVKVLRDGLSLTHAMGYTQPEVIDPLALSHIEIFRGANALEYGSSTLGGAIIFISPTGYTADKFKVGMRAGSYGYLRPYVSSGMAFQNGFDYYLSSSYYYSNGFRNSDDDVRSPYVNSNFGYRWNDKNETRFFYDYAEDRIGFPSALFQSELERNPKLVTNPGTINTTITAPFYRFALKHTAKFTEANRLEFGAYYNLLDDYTLPLPGFGFGITNTIKDYGFNLRHEVTTPLWGKNHRIAWGMLANNATDKEWNFTGTTKNSMGTLDFHVLRKANNVEFFAQDEISLTGAFRVIPGLQIAYSRRYQTEFSGGSTFSKNYVGVNPKLGFLWEAAKEVQLFANVNRSFEPPIVGFGPNFVGGNNKILDAQSATTVEIGTRGSRGRLSWEFAFFHSWVKDELLTERDPNNPLTFVNSNANTIHAGIEWAGQFIQPLGWLTGNDRLRLQTVFTYNHFRFDGGTFDGNVLPLLPPAIGNMELRYEQPLGFYVALNLKGASSAWVDFKNNLKANPYAVLGARIGYTSSAGWSTFIEGQNLTNTHYANRISPTSNVTTADARRFYPGITRGFYGGFEYKFNAPM